MRNWSAILIDAGLRGISTGDVAREQHCCLRNVQMRCRKYGVRLDWDKAKAGAANARNANNRWLERIAETPSGLNVNEFCRLHECSHGQAQRVAKRYGYKFAPSKARA